MNIGKLIRSVRLSKGIKAKFVAEKLNLHITSYAAIESGKRSVTVDRIVAIADILGVSVTDFFCQEVSETLNKENYNKRGLHSNSA